MEDADMKLIIDALKARWFSLAVQEDYPNTPVVSEELDRLETQIKKLASHLR